MSMTKIAKTDACWLEVYHDGAVGPDFGWPAVTDKFANLGPCPWPQTNWPGLLWTWLDQVDCDGDAVEGIWTRAYLIMKDAGSLLDAAFGPDDPGSRAIQARLNSRHRYIVFAQLQTCTTIATTMAITRTIRRYLQRRQRRARLSHAPLEGRRARLPFIRLAA